MDVKIKSNGFYVIMVTTSESSIPSFVKVNTKYAESLYKGLPSQAIVTLQYDTDPSQMDTYNLRGEAEDVLSSLEKIFPEFSNMNIIAEVVLISPEYTILP